MLKTVNFAGYDPKRRILREYLLFYDRIIYLPRTEFLWGLPVRVEVLFVAGTTFSSFLGFIFSQLGKSCIPAEVNDHLSS